MRVGGATGEPLKDRGAIPPARATEGGSSRDPAQAAKTWRELGFLALGTLGFCALFLGKAFSIDDPLFLWLAHQVQQHPLDFFGFDVNWYGTEMPMHEVTQNPPLNGYYLALAGTLFGWGERGLHAAYLLPALLAVAGIYGLSRRLCSQPVPSTLLAVATPAFLVSSTSVMCDTWMLALWCGCLFCWIRGFDRSRWQWHAVAVLLAGLACLTKYFAVALVPLCAAYGLFRERRAGLTLAWLAIPVAVLLAYETYTASLYGHGLLRGAVAFANTSQSDPTMPLPEEALIGLLFLGGFTVHPAFFAGSIGSRRATLVLLGASVLVLALAAVFLPMPKSSMGELLDRPMWRSGAGRALFVLHVVAFGVSGCALLALVVAEARERFSAETALLGLWIVGTFFFATFLNWANNARSILPLVPAVGILIVRRYERRIPNGASRTARFLARFAPGALVAVLVARGDTVWANQVREAARAIAADLAASGRKTSFQGHWGFQLYMEAAGIRHMHLTRDVLEPGELLAIPSNNTHAFPPPKNVAVLSRRTPVSEPGWIRTCSFVDGAGFYGSNVGPLPFVLGAVTPDLYLIYEVRQQFRYSTEEEYARRGKEAVMWRQ